MEINKHRLREDIMSTAEFGAIEMDSGLGRTVVTGTEADRQVREYFAERLRAAGLDVRVDRVGNIAGKWTPPNADANKAPVATGSHLDSVPRGGIFDGPLGVYAALEAVRTLQEADLDLIRPIEVVSFTEEEGHRFPTGLLGSSVVGGQRSVEEAIGMTDDDGVTLREALSDIGFLGEECINAGDWNAWLEIHIEQDTRLEQAGVPVGVVTTITGISTCRVQINGQADHAGTTSMYERNDALTAAGEFILDIERAGHNLVASDSETAVCTVGQIDAKPNVSSIVPGQVELEIDIRDIDHANMNELAKQARRSLARIERTRDVKTSFDRYRDQRPTRMSPRCRQAVFEGAADTCIETLELHSGATHDTANIAAVTDSALLFAPSEGGISHSPLEWTDWNDCAAATEALTHAIKRLAT